MKQIAQFLAGEARCSTARPRRLFCMPRPRDSNGFIMASVPSVFDLRGP